MLKTQIKASQITNLTDARYFAAWGINWMGFDMEEGSDHFIPPANFLAIKEWIEGPKLIGEYALQSASDLIASAKELGLDGVQLGPFFPTEELSALKPLLIIQKLVIDRQSNVIDIQQSLENKNAFVDQFILDFAANGISWQELKAGTGSVAVADLKRWAAEYPILLDLSFEPADYQALLDLGIQGFSLKGGAEEKVGFKSFDDLNDLFEAMELD